MLLRRVIKHVKEQNWTAVALDFCIVVVGVFIGIQVANWNADRAQREVEKRYASYLHEEISANIEYFNDRVETYEDFQNALIGYYDYLNGNRNAPPDDETLRRVLCKFGINRYGAINTSVYDELVASGRLGLIGARPARKALSDFRENLSGLNAYMAVTDPPLQRAYRKLAPYRERKLNREDNATQGCLLKYELMESDKSVAPIIAEVQNLEHVYLTGFETLRESAVEAQGALEQGYPHILKGAD